jgi:hypothetical protein
MALKALGAPLERRSLMDGRGVKSLYSLAFLFSLSGLNYHNRVAESGARRVVDRRALLPEGLDPE